MAKSKDAAGAKKQPETRRYKLVAGLHQDKDGLHDAKDPKTNLIESSVDLAKRFPEKFRKLDDAEDLPRAPSSGLTDAEGLENLSDQQLAQLAKDNEIDLTGANSREDAIELIRNAMEGQDLDDDNA
jgi:hypothetical protein